MANPNLTVQRWKCEGYKGYECNVMLDDIRSSKPKKKCASCCHEAKKLRERERYHNHIRKVKLKKFLRGNVS